MGEVCRRFIYIFCMKDFLKNMIFKKLVKVSFLFSCLQLNYVYADTAIDKRKSIKNSMDDFFRKKTDNFNQINIQELSNFKLDESQRREALPIVTSSNFQSEKNNNIDINQSISRNEISLFDAIKQALQRNPEISQHVANVMEQGENIHTAKAQYYPQVSGGISTTDLTSNEKGGQVYTLSATQVVYDFGKIKNSVNIEKAKLMQEQANALVSIDDIAYQTASALININRYQEIVKISHQQIDGISKIVRIANLRAHAGISSQADPVQAQSYLEAAESDLLVQQAELKQYQQTLRTLVGYDTSNTEFSIPDTIIRRAGLYEESQFSKIPKMMAAQAAIEVAQLQKQEVQLSTYPTIQLKNTLSQALNGTNPNNNKRGGFDNSIMFEASSTFFQGGAIKSKQRSASYAEEGARAELNTAYLDITNQIRLLRDQVDNKQKQMNVLISRKETTIRTKELYQEQYKLGTRTIVDLLNAEQAIHSIDQQIETTRYDIYLALVQYIYITGRSREVYNLNHASIQNLEILP